MNLASLPVRCHSIAPNWRTMQSIIDGSQDSILVIDKNLVITLVNAAYQASYKFFGDQPPLIGGSLEELYPHHPVFHQQLLGYVERALWGESFSVEEVMEESGEVSCWSFRFSPVWGGVDEVAGVIWSKRNCTEQYVAGLLAGDYMESHYEIENVNQILSTCLKASTSVLEEADRVLQYSDQRFKGIYDHTPTGIGLFDRSGRIVEANPALQQILGYDARELSRIPLSSLSITHQSNEDFVLFTELFTGKRESYQTEIQLIRSDGKTVWGLFNVSMLKDIQEEEPYAIGTIQDITSLKIMERTLQQKNLELEKTNNYLDNFVYAIAHDLRSPIANLKQISELLLMLKCSKDPIFEKLKISVDRLDRTATGLIEIIDAQKVENSQIVVISFAEKMSMIQAEMESKIRESHADIQLKFEVGRIVYIEPYLESIMRNLVQNALKYAHPDRTPHIVIRSYQESRYVVLSVQDNGIGIDLKEVGPRLFRPFKRFTSISSGNGIGLHLVKSMTEKNNGKVEVISELGKGTTFQIYLKPYDFYIEKNETPYGK